jgi:hypothetical protein
MGMDSRRCGRESNPPVRTPCHTTATLSAGSAALRARLRHPRLRTLRFSCGARESIRTPILYYEAPALPLLCSHWPSSPMIGSATAEREFALSSADSLFVLRWLPQKRRGRDPRRRSAPARAWVSTALAARMGDPGRDVLHILERFAAREAPDRSGSDHDSS